MTRPAAIRSDFDSERNRLAPRLLAWYDHCGRKHLPWQRNRDPYAIWISEIMLQQTQVATVIPYFNRFIERFPDIAALASGELDDVLHLWTGLGYYARARNLHAAARIIRDQHAGRFPDDPDLIYALPGIGKSTAHAILAFSHDRALPILDGNVKRVLTRHFRIHGWTGKASVERRLWRIAEENTPQRRAAAYTQAIMDLGATVCTRRMPNCVSCPLSRTCEALAAGEQTELPASRPRKVKPTRCISMIMVEAEGCILLEKRPPSGIWGGLWSLPELEPGIEVEPTLLRRYGVRVDIKESWDPMRHSFTHFMLDILPVYAELTSQDSGIMENTDLVWYNTTQPSALGLAAPVQKLLKKLEESLIHRGEHSLML